VLSFVDEKYCSPTPSRSDNFVSIFSVRVDREEACRHGVVRADPKGLVEDIIYRPDENQCSKE